MYNSKIISIRGVCSIKIRLLTIVNNVLFYYFQFIIAILNNKYMKNLFYFLIWCKIIKGYIANACFWN